LATQQEVEDNLAEVQKIIRLVKKPGWKKDAVIQLAGGWTIGGWGLKWPIAQRTDYTGSLCFTGKATFIKYHF